MNMIDAVKSYYRRFFDFKGRSSPSEFWWVFLFNVIIVTLLITGMVMLGGDVPEDEMTGVAGLLYIIYMIFVFGNMIPGIALWVRRFHDQNKSGWFALLVLAPFGPIIIIVFMCLAGTRGPNRYGYDPMGSSGDIFD